MLVICGVSLPCPTPSCCCRPSPCLPLQGDLRGMGPCCYQWWLQALICGFSRTFNQRTAIMASTDEWSACKRVTAFGGQPRRHLYNAPPNHPLNMVSLQPKRIGSICWTNQCMFVLCSILPYSAGARMQLHQHLFMCLDGSGPLSPSGFHLLPLCKWQCTGRVRCSLSQLALQCDLVSSEGLCWSFVRHGYALQDDAWAAEQAQCKWQKVCASIHLKRAASDAQ